MERINVAVVGLGFGGSFPPIYRDHPDVSRVAICDIDEKRLNEYGDRHGIRDRFSRYEEVLDADWIDAVHLTTPIPLHAGQSVRALTAGKHCACTVPMATSLEDLRAVIAAQRASGRTYMMMETSVYTRQCLLAEWMLKSGELGRIQFLRGAHYQDMENWPRYWEGLPPMWYATHAVSPLLALAGTSARTVRCLGSGVMRSELTLPYGNPFPVETALFELRGVPCAAEVTRTLFHVAHEYVESFSVYGEKKSIEWFREDDPLIVTTMDCTPGSATPRHAGNPISTEHVEAPDACDNLPERIRVYSRGVLVADPRNPHRSIRQGGGHHGSHPHMVHEFIRSLVERRPPRIDVIVAAEWTAAGICAHESARRGGDRVEIPDFR
jgi:predicted dehydrogenase